MLLVLELDVVVGVVTLVLDVVADALDVVACVEVALDATEVDEVPAGMLLDAVPVLLPVLLPWLLPPLVAPEDAVPEALPPTVLPARLPEPDIAWVPPSLVADGLPTV
jgi:hypothetical protein